MLKLREYQLQDVDQLVALADNENVSRYMIDTFPCPYTEKDARWWIGQGSCAPGMITRVIEVEGQLVGGIGLTEQAGWRAHVAEVGYWLGEPYWGKGYATTALRLMCGHAFSELQIRKLYATVLAPNKASMRILYRCGFTFVGVLEDEVAKHGRYYDIHLFERCNPLAE